MTAKRLISNIKKNPLPKGWNYVFCCLFKRNYTRVKVAKTVKAIRNASQHLEHGFLVDPHRRGELLELMAEVEFDLIIYFGWAMD